MTSFSLIANLPYITDDAAGLIDLVLRDARRRSLLSKRSILQTLTSS